MRAFLILFVVSVFLLATGFFPAMASSKCCEMPGCNCVGKVCCLHGQCTCQGGCCAKGECRCNNECRCQEEKVK